MIGLVFIIKGKVTNYLTIRRPLTQPDLSESINQEDYILPGESFNSAVNFKRG